MNPFNMMVFLKGVTVILVIIPRPIVLKFLIMFLSSAQKVAYYAQHYNIYYTAIMSQFIWNLIVFIDYISMVRLHTVMFYNAILQFSNIYPIRPPIINYLFPTLVRP